MATAEGFVRRLTRRLLESPEERDTVTLVWLGQRRIPGIDSGRKLRVHGRLGMLENGSKAIYNPHYEIQR